MIIKNLLPKYRQYRNWSLPSKYSFLGLLVGIVGLLIALASLMFSSSSKIGIDKIRNYEKQRARERVIVGVAAMKREYQRYIDRKIKSISNSMGTLPVGPGGFVNEADTMEVFGGKTVAKINTLWEDWIYPRSAALTIVAANTSDEEVERFLRMHPNLNLEFPDFNPQPSSKSPGGWAEVNSLLYDKLDMTPPLKFLVMKKRLKGSLDEVIQLLSIEQNN